jgi:aspartyl-tRNA(Asn)/glutamyl-tRNA(Gln) amidotransferase subunit C
MISKEEVEHIAKLARLGLTEKEIGKFQKELSLILDYVEKLKEVDVSKVEPTSHLLRVENVMRKDEVSKFNKKLIDGHLKVRSILK